MKRHSRDSPPPLVEEAHEDALLGRLCDWQRRCSAGDWEWLEWTEAGSTHLDSRIGDGVPGAVATLINALSHPNSFVAFTAKKILVALFLDDPHSLRPHLPKLLTSLTRLLLPSQSAPNPPINPYPLIWTTELLCKLLKSFRRNTLPPHIATALIAALSETAWIENVGDLIRLSEAETGPGVYMALSALFTLMQAVAKTAAVSVDENRERLAVVVRRIVRVVSGDGVVRLIERGAPSPMNGGPKEIPPHQHTLRKLLDLVHVLSTPSTNNQPATTSLLHIPAAYLTHFSHRTAPPTAWGTLGEDYTEFVLPARSETAVQLREPLKTSILTLLTVLAHILTSPNDAHDSAWRVLHGLDEAFSDWLRQGATLVDGVLRMYADNDAMMAAVLRVAVESYAAVCDDDNTDAQRRGKRVPHFVSAVRTQFDPHEVFARWIALTCGGEGDESDGEESDEPRSTRDTEAAALHILDQIINDDPGAGFTGYLVAYLRFASSSAVSAPRQQQHIPHIARILTCLADRLDQACEGGLFPFDARVLVRRVRRVVIGWVESGLVRAESE
ncbi:uncharacterized protein EV422DRAFT_262886 [Fimicolochytrium jonesii]|uniref:uncharacterized protein n=1 Tax=Fimicolochytrium jonesii TaxID=1396493 RepID=UPI0022FDB47B|nr:uncharacterized protein EV422DRAFT_262886 [Fimicolochytrium jonesii]KAI8817050.1 hypothetical protein EV422DRAFT_262886 [Fimicolochytrium jonesii]